jgi:hypothetical protein
LYIHFSQIGCTQIFKDRGAIRATNDYNAGRCTLAECLARNSTLIAVNAPVDHGLPESLNHMINAGLPVDLMDVRIGRDRLGKATAVGTLTNREEPENGLRSGAFVSLPFSVFHSEMGTPRTDYRSMPSVYGRGSLQVVVGPPGFYADVDRFAATDPVGLMLHIVLEVLIPRLGEWFNGHP